MNFISLNKWLKKMDKNPLTVDRWRLGTVKSVQGFIFLVQYSPYMLRPKHFNLLCQLQEVKLLNLFANIFEFYESIISNEFWWPITRI